MADLDAAIRATLAEIESTLTDDYGRVAEFGNLFAARPVAALRAVLVICDRLDLSIGEHQQAARLVREAIASALGVPQAEKPQP